MLQLTPVPPPSHPPDVVLVSSSRRWTSSQNARHLKTVKFLVRRSGVTTSAFLFEFCPQSLYDALRAADGLLPVATLRIARQVDVDDDRLGAVFEGFHLDLKSANVPLPTAFQGARHIRHPPHVFKQHGVRSPARRRPPTPSGDSAPHEARDVAVGHGSGCATNSLTCSSSWTARLLEDGGWARRCGRRPRC